LRRRGERRRLHRHVLVRQRPDEIHRPPPHGVVTPDRGPAVEARPARCSGRVRHAAASARSEPNPAAPPSPPPPRPPSHPTPPPRHPRRPAIPPRHAPDAARRSGLATPVPAAPPPPG